MTGETSEERIDGDVLSTNHSGEEIIVEVQRGDELWQERYTFEGAVKVNE